MKSEDEICADLWLSFNDCDCILKSDLDFFDKQGPVTDKRMKLLETLKDQDFCMDFWKQNSEVQRNRGFRLTLLVGMTLVHTANKTGKTFTLIGYAVIKTSRDMCKARPA